MALWKSKEFISNQSSKIIRVQTQRKINGIAIQGQSLELT